MKNCTIEFDDGSHFSCKLEKAHIENLLKCDCVKNVLVATEEIKN